MSQDGFIDRLIQKIRPAAVDWLEPEDLHRRIEGGTALALLDVRGADEFNGKLGHIPGAINIPLGELKPDQGDLRFLNNKDIVMVCHTDKRSAMAREILCAAGFTSVAVLRGGMVRWHDSGFAAALPPVDGSSATE